MSNLSELGHLAMPINYLAKGKIQMAQASFEPGTSPSPSPTLCRCDTVARPLDLDKAVFAIS